MWGGTGEGFFRTAGLKSPFKHLNIHAEIETQLNLESGHDSQHYASSLKSDACLSVIDEHLKTELLTNGEMELHTLNLSCSHTPSLHESTTATGGVLRVE